MKRCAFIVSVLALSLSTALSQGAGADSIRLRSAAGGSVWLLLPQTSTQQYRLLLPPSLGTSTNQLMWVNGTTGQISLLPPGSIGQILQVSSGGLSWVDPFSIVTINAWSLTGNSGTTPTTNFLGTTDNVGLALRTNNTERMRIAPNGNIGIGTTSPSQRLHVVATSDPLRLEGLQTDNTLDQVLVANASGVVKLRSASTLASSIAWSLTGNSGTNPTNNFLGTTDNQPLVIRTNNSERLRVTATGDVGIGTTTPSQRLHVASSSDPLRLEGVQTDNSLDQILVINNNGVVKRRSLSSLAGTSIFVQKTSNQSVISSTTYQNDNALVYSANANQVFEFEACMFISGGNGGIKIRINIPTGASMKLYAELKKDDQHHWTYAKLTSSSDEINWGTIDSNIGYARIRGIITMGSSGGNIQVQWAQNSSNSTATTVEAGSYLKITPIQ